MRIEINNSNAYELEWVKPSGGPVSFHRGDCDPPNVANPVIRICATLTGEELLDTLIHEFLHASAFQILDEEYVAKTATDMARELTRLGWEKRSGATLRPLPDAPRADGPRS